MAAFLAARAGAAGTHGAAGCPAQCPALALPTAKARGFTTHWIKWHLHRDEVCCIQVFSRIFGENAPLNL